MLSEKFKYLQNRKVIQLLGHYANLVGWQKIWPSITNCNIGMLIMKVKLLKVYTETSWRFKSKLWTCCAVFPIWLAWLMRQAGDLNTLWLKLLTLLPSSRLYISSRAWLQMTFTIFFVLPEALRSFSLKFYVLDVRTLSNFFFFLQPIPVH